MMAPDTGLARGAQVLRPRLLEPGLAGFTPGTERYRLRGGGSLTVALQPGDRIAVTDIEGRQPCELVAFDASGRGDGGVLGAPAVAAPEGLHAILESGAEDARRLRAALERRGLDLGAARALELFGAETPAGEAAEFEAQGEAVCLIAARGGPMRSGSRQEATGANTPSCISGCPRLASGAAKSN